MSQRHYLLNTNIDASDAEALQNELDTGRGSVVEIAECVNFIPLPWFACFRQNDLRPCTVHMTSGSAAIRVPVVDLPTAIANLKAALPLFEALTGETQYAREYWQYAIEDLQRLPLPFLTMDIGEMLMNCAADELIAGMTAALGSTIDALAAMKQFFLEYNDSVLPYGRAEFLANIDITDQYRIRNTIALNAAIQSNGLVRTKRLYSAHQAQPTPLTPLNVPTPPQNMAFELVSSKTMYELAYQHQEAGDYEQCVACYRKAITLADANPSQSTNMFENSSAAECNLADKYEHGLGVPQDYRLALEWYQKSAAKGNCVAQFSLGMMYKNGLGVPQDTAKALEWFRQSAIQGYPDANSQWAELSALAELIKLAEPRAAALRQIRQNPPANNGFAAGTLVHTKAGLRPIEALQAGDWVLTWPEDKPIPVRPSYPFRLEDEYIYKQVSKTLVHDDQIISHVKIIGNDEILRVTPNHPFWSKQHGWVPASVLKFGYTLEQANFANAMGKTKNEMERATVYNIEVAECHTCFVGKEGFWVHS